MLTFSWYIRYIFETNQYVLTKNIRSNSSKLIINFNFKYLHTFIFKIQNAERQKKIISLVSWNSG